jgi:DNA-binding transcriptional regulator GbsR (MarR family)
VVDSSEEPHVAGAPDNEAVVRFVEEFGSYFAGFGLSRATGLIWAYLLIADPPEQSTSDLIEALHISKGSVSTAGRQLASMGALKRYHKRGEREWYYLADTEVFSSLLKAKVREYTNMRLLLERGIEALADDPSRRHNIEEMRDIFAFYEERVPQLIDEYMANREREGR